MSSSDWVEMFKTKNSNVRKSEDVKRSAGKVLDTKKDTPTRAKVRSLNQDNIKYFFFELWLWLMGRMSQSNDDYISTA